MVKYSSLGGMAQLVEHSLHMRGVTGSSPVVSTNKNAHQLGCAFFVHRDNKRSRTRKLVFGVRRLLATACVMHRVYRSRHFVSLRCLFLYFTMQSSPCCLHQQPDCRVVFLYNGLEWRLHRHCAMFAQPVTKVTLHAIDLR